MSAHSRLPHWSTSSLLTVLGILALGGALVVVVALVYPGEFSHVSPSLNRWLYDRGAGTYEQKWRRTAYASPAATERIAAFASSAIEQSGVGRVLDLGCGTGRGTRQLVSVLPPAVTFVGIDFSAGMLEQFEGWRDAQPGATAARIEIRQADLGDWARKTEPGTYGLVLMLEVGEFLPRFADVLARASEVLAPGGGLIMTRPAGLWWLGFPRRQQSRAGLCRLLRGQGMEIAEVRPWRSRYELLFATRA